MLLISRLVLSVAICLTLFGCTQGNVYSDQTSDLVYRVPIIYLEFPARVVSIDGDIKLLKDRSGSYLEVSQGTAIDESDIIIVSKNSVIILESTVGKRFQIIEGSYVLRQK
jgi:hypothetical protein